ncbi:GNAT family N-acetyltransferase [Undibacterium pigrum]|uniref:Ribosomal protein S18 acetylase RimI-like enzyme n=1 Tax=Undibacterium pigrum TaxID=401470 RepID=A0A318JCB0_9BURK|nr:GNAT family N-acetyltransferase [Undibacterium pigrum]PXX41458.1 ribosomal protein S18 acetylase RimI-like enzyme [Undibacterium pigrum]
MKNNWSIRPATHADIAIITRHRFHREDEQQQDLDAYANWLAGTLAAGNYLGLLAQSGDTVVAGAGLSILDWGPIRGDTQGHRGRIVNVYTAPDWRRLGIARALVAGVLQLGKERGLKTFNLSASEQGQALYQDLGFVSYPTEMIYRA